MPIETRLASEEAQRRPGPRSRIAAQRHFSAEEVAVLKYGQLSLSFYTGSEYNDLRAQHQQWRPHSPNQTRHYTYSAAHPLIPHLRTPMISKTLPAPSAQAHLQVTIPSLAKNP